MQRKRNLIRHNFDIPKEGELGAPARAGVTTAADRGRERMRAFMRAYRERKRLERLEKIYARVVAA